MASRQDSRTPHQTAAAPSPGPPPRRRARRRRDAPAPGSRGARRGRTTHYNRSAVLLLPPLGRRLRTWPETRAPRGAREILARGRRGAAQRVRGAAFFVIFLLRVCCARCASAGVLCCRSTHHLLIACCAALLLDCTLARREVQHGWSLLPGRVGSKRDAAPPRLMLSLRLVWCYLWWPHERSALARVFEPGRTIANFTMRRTRQDRSRALRTAAVY